MKLLFASLLFVLSLSASAQLKGSGADRINMTPPDTLCGLILSGPVMAHITHGYYITPKGYEFIGMVDTIHKTVMILVLRSEKYPYTYVKPNGKKVHITKSLPLPGHFYDMNWKPVPKKDVYLFICAERDDSVEYDD